jgi:hypothetical protein
MLRSVGIHGQLMEVAHQLRVVQRKALHLAVQLPALRRGIPARIPRQAAGWQLQPAARAGGRAAHGVQARASKQTVSSYGISAVRSRSLELPTLARRQCRNRPKLGNTLLMGRGLLPLLTLIDEDQARWHEE